SDMAGVAPTSPAARRYASAAFLVAQEANGLDVFEKDVASMQSFLAEESLAQIVADPRVEAEKRSALFDKACPDLGESARGLLAVLTTKRRLEILNQVLNASEALLDSHYGRSKGTVESAELLSDEDIGDLEAVFSRKTGQEVSLEQEINPSLLGGVRVTLSGTQWDASARGRLDNLRNNLETVELD
ncbi:MAG TPA: ATP synthase F1 subunit delta, partial [Planctomycetes bacterium]|nr:ATP synthase F1 subunit delta [Planctomycetota bacterium]